MPNRLYVLNKGKGEGEKMLKVGRKRKVITFVGFSPLYIKKKTKNKNKHLYCKQKFTSIIIALSLG